MKLKTTLFAAAAALAVAPAAHAYQGFYGAIGAGFNYLQPDQDVESIGFAPAFDSEADYNNGIGVYTALGYDWGNSIRGEIEFSYRQNDARHYAGDGLGFSGWPVLDGDLQARSIMFNLIKDFDTGHAITPFVGLGVGGTSLKNQVSGADFGFGTLVIDDTSKRLAYQAIAGLAVQLAEGLSLDLSYRYFAAAGTPKFDALIGGSPASISHDYDTHTLFAGLRWNFGAAAAPAAVEYKDCWDGSSVPVAADCPPQLNENQSANLDPVNVIVYFDYDKANLTPEASNLIKEAAARALANDVDTVVVSGHADRSGGSAYNQGLSERRGSVVRDSLIANGIAADKIRMEAYGEDKPAKPTEDGIREPLNRRTEVVISFE